MTTFLPILAAVLVASVPLTSGQNRCCAPAQVACDVVFAGKKQYNVAVDFVTKKAVECYQGNFGIEYILDDGASMIRYKRMADGTCTKSPITINNYFQCVPESAVYQQVPAEYGVSLDGWVYDPNSHTRRLVVVETQDCLPYRVVQNMDGHVKIAHFINLVVGGIDSSVFDKDVSDCVAA